MTRAPMKVRAMPRDKFLHRARTRWSLALPALLIFSSACGNEDQSERAALLATPAAKHLVGTWTAKFWIDAGPRRSKQVDSTTVAGTISLEEDRYGSVSTDALQSATHAGVYNVDFSKFGFSSRQSDELPAAIASVSRQQSRDQSKDSVTIVLSPGTALYPVVMTGLVYGDSAIGQWYAAAYRSGGMAGRFAMKRLR